jgi:hypothetical protein
MASGFANMNIFSYTKLFPSAFTMYFTRMIFHSNHKIQILQLPAMTSTDIWHPWGAALCLEGMGLCQLNTEIKPIPTKQQSVSRIRIGEALVQSNFSIYA